MSDPRPSTSGLNDSLFLGPSPSLDAPPRPAPASGAHAASTFVPGDAPWWSAATADARRRAALETGTLPGTLRPKPRPPVPEPVIEEDPAPPAGPVPWWSPARERRALPPEPPLPVRPIPLRPTRMGGVRPARTAPAKPATPPWWSKARTEHVRVHPAAPHRTAAGTAANGPWWTKAPAPLFPREDAQRVRVSANATPWWSAAAWEMRPAEPRGPGLVARTRARLFPPKGGDRR